MNNLNAITKLPNIDTFGRVFKSEYNSLSFSEYTIYDAGFTVEQYQATPIEVINKTLAYMKPFGGGTLQLPAQEITVKVGEEVKPEGWSSPYYKVIIPAEEGLQYCIKGHGKKYPINIDTSLLTGGEATGGWNLIEVGDQSIGTDIWSYTSLASGVTDPGSRNYDSSKMLDWVCVENLFIKGDEPDADPGLTRFETYDYQIGGIRIGCAKVVFARRVHVSNTLNSGLVCGFYERAYISDCSAANIGYRKAPNQPANFLDLIGMGSDYYKANGVRSVAFVDGCYCDAIHDVAYMGIWSDVHLNNCCCHRTAIAVEHQASWAATNETELGGNWYIRDCNFNCNTKNLLSGDTLKFGDAIIASGGNQKNMVIRDTVIDKPSNMAVAAYMQSTGGRVTVDNVTIIGAGWGNYTEFPTLLMSKGDLYINGGRFIDLKHDIYQLISSGNLYAGDRTDLSGCTKNLISDKSPESKAQIKVNVLDSVGMCRIGSDKEHVYDYDIDIRFEAHSGSQYVLLQTWDEKAVGISAKIKLDMNNACPNMRPIVSDKEGNYGVVNLEIVNFDFKNIDDNTRNGSYESVHTSSDLYVNEFKPEAASVTGIDFITLKTSSGSGVGKINDILSNFRSVYLTKQGLNLGLLSTLGSAPATLTYISTNALQLKTTLIQSCFPVTGWTVVFQIDSFDFRNEDDNDTREQTLLYAMEKGNSFPGKFIKLAHQDKYCDTFDLTIGGKLISIGHPPGDVKMMVSVSYSASGKAILAVNGKAQEMAVGALPDFTLGTGVVYIGVGLMQSKSQAEMFDLLSGNCNLQKLAFIDRSFDKPFLERLTQL